MTVKSIILVMVYLQTYTTNGRIICESQMYVEWRTQPRHHIVKWTPNNICSDFYTDCWNINTNIERNVLEQQALNIPQICPLQIQMGDSLFISSEPSFQSHGMTLGNVSMEEFIRCPRKGFPQDQLIFGYTLRGMHQVDPQWLGVGTHYFAEVQTKGPLLCNLGLRLNVAVKQQFCQQSVNAPLCSRHGRCLSHIWEEIYNCYCSQQYSGRFCQEFDACSSKPCHNNASCIDIEEGSIGDSYECACPSQFAGKNCSEIIGQCQPQVCLNGNCNNVTPNTFLCECNKEFTGPFCEEPVEPCTSQPCLNEGICHNTQHRYVCDCPVGFFGHDCETDVNECSSRPCQNGATCVDMPNDVACICPPMFTGKFCDSVWRPCELSPCLNNGTCSSKIYWCICSCRPEFTGKNCEEVIDYCRLLSINCLNEGLCLNIIGGFRCLCAPGWTGEFCQLIENACLIYPDICYNGATCINKSQLKEQPQFQCLCLRGFTGSCFLDEDNQSSQCVCAPGWTGQTCLENINDCEGNWCQHGATCEDGINEYRYSPDTV
uniref:EGF-like domain-containing protein n=1 Tax=Pelusios castaneus TaxID=367368 RepID=A0A8C8RYB2_9SAUR